MREAYVVLEGLTIERNAELVGRHWDVWARRACLLLVAAVAAAALANVFGQSPETTSSTTGRATLEILGPPGVRGGLLFQSRITVKAHEELKDARIVLAPGWSDGFQMNTIEPSPIGEASADGSLSFDLGHIPRGEKFALWLQFQVDPPSVGGRNQDVDLFDGNTHLLTVHHHLIVFP